MVAIACSQTQPGKKGARGKLVMSCNKYFHKVLYRIQLKNKLQAFSNDLEQIDFLKVMLKLSKRRHLLQCE